MQAFEYIKNDAFTSKGSSGNPAACIYLKKGEHLSEAQMQAIATEHKGFVSEVIYCSPTGATPQYQLRYYSSECEVDFCGHGTIACLHYLAENTPELRDSKEISIGTVKGDLVVYNELQNLDAIFITAPDPKYLTLAFTQNAGAGRQKECPSGVPSRNECKSGAVSQEGCTGKPEKTAAEALGLCEQALDSDYAMELIDAGLRTLILPIRELDAILGMHPDESSLKDFCLANGLDIILVFCVRVTDCKNKIRTRVFAPKFGYLEDKATGSGNSALGYYMLKHKMWDGGPISIEQNGERQCYNTVRLKTLNGKVLFGGGATVKIKGSYLTD